MRLSEVPNHIGRTVTMNGRGDLAMSQPYRKYLFPRPEVTPLFTIIKVTRGGMVQIQAENGEYLSVRADNIDLPGESEEKKSSGVLIFK